MKNIREKLGLTQDQMSGLLGINRSSAAMYENGSRSIATKNLLLLSEIEIFLNNNVHEIIHSEINTDHAKGAIITKLNKQIDRAAFACLKLKRRLKLLHATNLKTKNLWSVLVHLKLKMPGNLPLLAYLEILEIDCLEKTAKCGLDKQAEISLKIKTLKFKQAAAKSMIEELKA